MGKQRNRQYHEKAVDQGSKAKPEAKSRKTQTSGKDEIIKQ